MDWREIVIYAVFLLTPFVTFPYILITARRGGDHEGDGERR